MGRTYSCWMLNCWCITWPEGFKRLIILLVSMCALVFQVAVFGSERRTEIVLLHLICLVFVPSYPVFLTRCDLGEKCKLTGRFAVQCLSEIRFSQWLQKQSAVCRPLWDSSLFEFRHRQRESSDVPADERTRSLSFPFRVSWRNRLVYIFFCLRPLELI